MKMNAQVMLRVNVPFEYEIEELLITTEIIDGRERIRDHKAYEQQLATVESQRIKAAMHAESNLVDHLTHALPRGVSLVEAVIEEVSEA